jgi:23S rRNA (adenine2503-C2)-methyltransferase
MHIHKNIEVPTGNILVAEGTRGMLEFLSIGDYGKEVNLKCDALGLTEDIEKVVHKEMLPLQKKWVITISTQYGCSMGCTFCDVPKVGPGVNVTHADLVNQIIHGLSLHPEVTHGERLNIHYARMGEPTFNEDVLSVSYLWRSCALRDRFDTIHPVVSTMMPRKNKRLSSFLTKWMEIKNDVYQGEAGLQLSINSTNEAERQKMFSNNALDLESIAELVQGFKPVGRKITLNFAVADYEIDPNVLLKYFDPGRFIIKLTPMHKTHTALENGIETLGDYTTFYPYKEYEEKLKAVGFDVLVFIASVEEDLGRITCGNAILSGSKPDY